MILSDFDYGMSLHDTQHFALGQEVYDSQGNRWGYAQIEEVSGGAHRLMRSKEHADFMSANSGATPNFAAAQGIGTDRITVANTTNANFAASTIKNIIGALGVITTGPGLGQEFWVKRVVSATEIAVEVVRGDDGNGKWGTALTTASKFALWFPGEVYQNDGVGNFIEGVLHYNAVTADIGKFAYLQRSGRGLITLDVSAGAPGAGDLLVPVASGLVDAMTAPGTADAAAILAAAKNAASAIGRAVHDIAGTTDSAILASLNIPAVGVSFAGARTQNPYNRVTIGSN